MNTRDPILLSDEQVQRYIADGFIAIDTKLNPSLHASITEAMGFCLANELPHPGDNILPRIPDLNEILESAVVRGALTSLLGPGYFWAPHRFPHNSEPLADTARSKPFEPFDNQPEMGKGSVSGSSWHQDGHSWAGRGRWHTFRAANLFYFPHATPIEMGATRLLAGSHLYATLRGTVAEQVVLRDIPAGTVLICDFDIGHAGTPNRSNTSRYMVKFVALRTQNPVAPSWDHQQPLWHTPEKLMTPHNIPQVWTSLWNWLRAAPRSEGIGINAATERPDLIERMRSADHGVRLAGLYDLIAMGAAAVDVLVQALRQTTGLNRHLSPPVGKPEYYGMSKNHLDRTYSNRQFVPEDAAVALGAIGAPALAALLPLLDHADPWIRINAAYALGEAGPSVVGSHADDVGKLLADPEETVVRAALDALCSLTSFGSVTTNRIHHLLVTDTEGWEQSAMGEPHLGRGWTIQNHIRYLGSLALLARASNPDPPEGLEAALLAGLADDSGYVPAVACKGLERLETISSLKAAVSYLQGHRWDVGHYKFAHDGLISRQHRVARAVHQAAS